ncbi:MAG: AAA family ATPase [Alphaproteobacteria bacterium]|nr:AAA family ATPase [Alphaproteobacteria bacterium]
MRLKRLAVNRLPGISQSFEIELAEAGFHVVFGPNGIGKSSICRAVESLYWQDRGPEPPTSVSGEFELDGETWWAEREGPRLRWQRGGEDSLAPDLPPSHTRHCFFLRLLDLMDLSPHGTQDIASEIRRQMSGGFDLDQITTDLFAGAGPRHGRSEWKDFNRASLEIQDAEGRQSGLQRRADQLQSLNRELVEADQGAHRLPALERALGLAGRRQELAALEQEMAILPGALAKLGGNEVEEIERLQAQVDELGERSRELQKQMHDASQAQRDIALPGILEAGELAAWQSKASELGRLELALQAAATDNRSCLAELAAALSAMGGGEVDEVELNLDDHGQLFEFLRDAEAHKARTGVVEERLRLLSQLGGPEGNQHNLDKIRDAADVLRSWLRAPAAQSLGGRIRARPYWLGFACVLVVAGAALGLAVDPLFAVLMAIAAGVAGPVLLPSNPGARDGGRKTAEERFANLGPEGPDIWDIPSVESRLRQLEGEAATLDAHLRRERDRDVERQTLKNELEGLAATETGLEARRQSLQDGLKLAAIRPDTELVDFARGLDQLRSARRKQVGAAAKVADLEARHTALLEEMARILEDHGEAVPTDAATAGARLDNLDRRNTRLIQAQTDQRRAAEQLEQVAGDQAAAGKSLRRIYGRAELEDGDLPGLKALLNSLPHYAGLKHAAQRLASQNELDRAELGKAEEAELAEGNAPALEQLHGELSQKAGKAGELRGEIAEIKAQVEAARSTSNVQDLLSLREQARTKLQDRRFEALFEGAGRFLVGAVEEEHEQTQMPRVFERARNHFSAFTHHGYELRLAKQGQTPRLIASDLASGEGRGLDELSDGTRTQLLLAARLAFAEEVEGGKTLPLFLDEALDQSDPARFAAMVRSLGRVAKDQQRQIFYFTSDPLDIDRIQQALAEENCEKATSSDLGLIRTKAASVSGPGALKVGPRSSVPAPNGASSEEYGAKLGVPVLRPAQGFAAQHFFYVLWDELDLLHDFLVHGIERAGRWKTVSGTALADKLGSRSLSSRQIALRLDLLEVFCELWKQGRGRPVDRQALENSAAVTERYLDDVVAIAAELGGDPERLLAELAEKKDPRLRGFRSASFDQLERYLHDHGYLDDQPILTGDELQLRALTSPAANELAAGPAGECLHRWWNWAAQA